MDKSTTKEIALSTTEAKIIAASEEAKELVWLKHPLSELLSDFAGGGDLYIDNSSAIKLTKNPEHHKSSKHIEVQHFYMRERYLNDYNTLTGENNCHTRLQNPLNLFDLKYCVMKLKLSLGSNEEQCLLYDSVLDEVLSLKYCTLPTVFTLCVCIYSVG